MARHSKIPWTDNTWNPVAGCDPISPGCKYCYAVGFAHRYPWGRGLTVIKNDRAQWSGEVQLHPTRLDEPLRWRAPVKIFPCSGADYCHDKVPFEYMAAMFAVACEARRHTFQFLTKRPERLLLFDAWLRAHPLGPAQALYKYAVEKGVAASRLHPSEWSWPPPNVWLGVSVEGPLFTSRIDEILKLDAAVYWASLEPLLERADIRPWLKPRASDGRRLDWVVVGGESGNPGHTCRPCAMEWIEEVRDACLELRVPVFVKQLGSWVVSEERMAASMEEARDLLGPDVTHPWLWSAGLEDPKGEDPEEWPEEYRVQLFPGDVIPPYVDPATLGHDECPF